MGRRHGLEPGHLLERARSFILKGKVQAAFPLLDRAARAALADPGRAMDVLVPLVRLATTYERADLALQWIEKLSSLQAGCEEAQLEIETLRLWIHFAEKRAWGIKARIDAAFKATTRWKPWMVEFQWFYLLNENRLEEFDRALRAPSGCAIQSGTIEFARRLLYLGIRCKAEGRLAAATIVLRAAARKLAAIPGPESQNNLANTFCWLARAQSELGQNSQALCSMREAEAIARRLPIPHFQYLRDQSYGQVYSRAGEYKKALESYLKTCLLSRRRTVFHAYFACSAYLKAAQCALLLGRREQARLLVQRARPLIKVWPNPWLRGGLRLAQGDVHRERGTPAGYRAARKCYREALEIFRSQGSGLQLCIGLVHLSLGRLYLRERRIPQALRQADQGMKIGRQTSTAGIQTDSLLLKSFLLLEQKAPRAQIYDDILRQLGLLKEPVVLFKVLANLYLYSWDLGDQLELTDLHLKQLDRLRESISPPIYDQLYRTYVSARVAARFRRRFGLDDDASRRAIAF